MASYPGTIRTFSTHVNTTEVIDASHVNDLQDEVTAVQRSLAVNPQVSTAGGGSTLGAWSGTSRSYASLNDRLANIEAGVVGDAHTQYARLSGDAVFTGTKTLSGPTTLFGTGTGTSSAELVASTGTTGGQAGLTFREGVTGRWRLYRDQGSQELRLRDLLNNRDHMLFAPGASSTTASTTLDSSLTVQGNLTVTGTVASGTAALPDVRDRTFAIPGELLLPSSGNNVIPGFFVPATGTTRLLYARHIIASGTSVTLAIHVNGAAAVGYGAVVATTAAASTDAADIVLPPNAYVQPVLTALSGAPKALSLTLILQYTS